jgi:hypothetical protein
MDFLGSAIENQKRKQNPALASSTATTTTGPKFQRRGAAAQRTISNLSSVIEPQTAQPPTSSTTTSTTTSTTSPTTQPPNVDDDADDDDDENTLIQLKKENKQDIEFPKLSPADRILVTQQQQDRLDELALIRMEKYRQKRNRSEFNNVNEYVNSNLKRYLWIWEQDLLKRTESEAQSILGRTKLGEYEATRSSMVPLFSQVKKHTIKSEILICLTDVLEALDERDYITAQQAFYEVAIGNNPWPIGLPKVGIHERRARAKIDPSLIDHIMKDPIIEAYMQSLKRLIAYVERRFPPIVAGKE